MTIPTRVLGRTDFDLLAELAITVQEQIQRAKREYEDLAPEEVKRGDR